MKKVITDRRRQKIVSVVQKRQPDLTIVLEGIHDPHNVSAIMRTADAVGLPEVQLVYEIEAFPKLGKKSSASALKWVRRRQFRSIGECYDRLRAERYRIYATRLGAASRSIYELDLTGRVALVFGNEHRGVSDRAAELADGNFQIPMTGMIGSLNVSVACAVVLYEAFRQRQLAGCYANPSMSPSEQQELIDEWVNK